MKTKLKKTLAKELNLIITNLKPFTGSPRPDGYSNYHYSSETNYAYSQETRRSIARWENKFLKETSLDNQISQEEMHRNCLRVFGDLILSSDCNYEEAIVDLLGELNSIIKMHNVYIPLFGIVMMVRFLAIGRVSFSRLMPTLPKKDIEWQDMHFRRMFLESLGEGTFAKCTVYAEPIKAKEIAIVETRRALDILRYAIVALSLERGHRMMVTLEDEFKLDPNIRNITIVPDDESSVHIQGGELDGHYQPLIIDKHFISKLKEVGVFKLSHVLQKTGGTSAFEDCLLRSVHWFADAQFQSENENKLLSLMTSLEVLFNPSYREQLANAIAEGAALIVGVSLEERISIRKTIKTHYSNRSDISHGNKYSINKSDVNELLALVRKAVVTLVNRMDDFKDKDDLELWLLKERLAPTQLAEHPKAASSFSEEGVSDDRAS